MSAWLALALLIASFIILLQSHDIPTIAGYSSVMIAAITTACSLVIYSFELFRKDQKFIDSRILQYIGVFASFGVIFFCGYQLRNEILYVAHQVDMQVQQVSNRFVSHGIKIIFPEKEGGEIIARIRRQSNGHFIARTNINSIPLNLIVDTGASLVTLKSSDAKTVGININSLKFDVPVQTANGVIKAARVKLYKVSVGPLTAYNVDAFVFREGTLSRSLLGLSYLNRLRSYNVSGDNLSLKG